MMLSLWLAGSFLLSSVFAQNPAVIPFSVTNPAQIPNAELSRLFDRALTGKRVLAIGESVHGSARYEQFQLRMVRYLVEQKGYRTVVLENPVLRSAPLTEWVASCRAGAPAKLPLERAYFPDEDYLVLFNWMCGFNRLHPRDAIVFRGMDIWDRAWEHQARMEQLSRALQLGYEARLAVTRAQCWVHNDSDWSKYPGYTEYLKKNKNIPSENYKPCMQALEELRTLTRKWIVTASGERRYRLFTMLQSVETTIGLQSNLNYRYERFGLDWNSRDLAQARNVFSIYHQEGQKPLVILSHTSHMSKMDSPSDWWGTGEGEFRSNISFLRPMMPGQVLTLGLTGYDVTGAQGNWIKPESPESLDLYLHEKGFSLALVNPFAPEITARPRWWMQNENAPGKFANGVYMIPKDNFDLFVFFDQSLVSTAIPPKLPLFRW